MWTDGRTSLKRRAARLGQFVAMLVWVGLSSALGWWRGRQTRDADPLAVPPELAEAAARGLRVGAIEQRPLLRLVLASPTEPRLGTLMIEGKWRVEPDGGLPRLLDQVWTGVTRHEDGTEFVFGSRVLVVAVSDRYESWDLCLPGYQVIGGPFPELIEFSE